MIQFQSAARAARPAPGELALSGDYRLAPYPALPAPPLAGLTFEARSYPEENAIEWQVRLRAPEQGESPLWDDIQSADCIAAFTELPTLHWSKGSHDEAADFRPMAEPLQAAHPFSVESFGGRSSDGAMPYFNLAAKGGGLIIAVGWTGDWKATFDPTPDGKVHITAGLRHTHFRLAPGESVRIPSILLMAYRGDWLDGQNQFRRLMLRRFTPPGAPEHLMPVAASVHGMIGFNDTTEANLTALAADIGTLKLPLDTYWLDAGWNVGGFPGGQGNTAPDPARYPRGLAPVGEAARNAGLRFLMWFEPERAMRGTMLDRDHPDWLLSPANTPDALRYQENDGFRLFDFANPAARAWMLDTVSTEIASAGIAIYRQDFNQYPSYFWQNGEAPEAIGLREVRYINGLYDYLDGLVARHPGLIMDNCASGGRRLDFEMMRRCVALWRSDSCWDAKTYPQNVQAMTHGLSLWLPLHGLGAAAPGDVALRSGMGACASFAINYRDPASVEALRKHLDRYQKVRMLYAADYHPLTDWTLDATEWIAFQFNDPKKGEGIAQAFTGPHPKTPTYKLRLKNLDPAKRYTITDWDAPTPTEHTGAELMETGIEIQAKEATPQAVVIHYALASQP